MLQILHHPNLPHQLVLVLIHSSQGTNMCKNVLQSVCELECVDIAETELHVGIDDEFCKSEDFMAEMEGVSEM